jgi:fatty-acyl-CoA synthase
VIDAMALSEITATMQVDSLTIVDILEHGSTWNSTCRVWTVRENGDLEKLTFGDVGALAARLANGLASLGVSEGDRVGSYMWNTAEHLAAYLAVPSMGAVLHTANIRLTPEQNAYTITAAGDRVLIADASLIDDLVSQLPSLTTVETVVVNGDTDLAKIRAHGKSAVLLTDLLADAASSYPWPVIDERAPASICFTTGTTGMPKGVVYSHRSTWIHAMSLCTMNALRIGGEDSALIAVPMFHANAWGYPYAAFWSGADLILPSRHVQAPALVSLIERFNVTFANGVPTVWKDVLRYLHDNPEHDISSLDRLVVGGAAASAEFIAEFADLHDVQVVQGWGMTETSPLVSTARPPRGASADAQPEYRASQGRVLPGVRIRLVQPDTGEVLPADGVAVGEFELRGPWISGSYLGGDGAEKFRDGWLRTGDVGTLDSYGFVRLTDRAKDVIKSGGEWISSVELEHVISAHPDVQDVAVIGVPDPRWDERPCVVVVTRPGAPSDALVLRDWLRDKVARWWLPERWAFMAQIPLTSVGKTDKKLLRQQFADGAMHVVVLDSAAPAAARSGTLKRGRSRDEC